MTFIQLLYRLLMLICGWKPLERRIINEMKVIKRALVIYPHTSYWDAVTILVYKYAFNLNTVHVVVHAGAYYKYPKLMKLLNALPATPRERNNGGFVNETVGYFQNKCEYYLFISPKGTLKKDPWRSGYYHIAKGLNLPIYVIGFDYYTHTMKMVSSKQYDVSDYELLSRSLKNDMGCITPLHKNCSEVDLVYTDAFTFPVDLCTTTTVLLPLPGLYMLYSINTRLFLIMVIAYFYSWRYHYTMEQCCRKIEPTVVCISMITFVYSWIYYEYISHNFIYYFIAVLSLFAWWMGTGRHITLHRSRNYIIWHTLFHALASVWCTFQIWSVYCKI
jgi:hypothetical protein